LGHRLAAEAIARWLDENAIFAPGDNNKGNRVFKNKVYLSDGRRIRDDAVFLVQKSKIENRK